MRKSLFILGISPVFFAFFAQASVVEVCDLASTPLDGEILSQVSAEQVQTYKQHLAKECELSSKYKALKTKLRETNQVNLTDIAEYQAIRFVQRTWLNAAEQDAKPVEIIYQMFRKQYDLPYSQQSKDIWDAWAVGIRQLEPVIASFKNGESFNLDVLKKIHRGLFPFYPMFDEHGDVANDPRPGVLKPTSLIANDTYWWKLETPADVSAAQKIVDHENEVYKRLGIETPAPKGLPDYVSKILDVRETESREDGRPMKGLFSGSGVVNHQNVELILEMVDTLIKKARAGQHMVWKNNLFTPAELAYFVQQAYVRVHPFCEGNGRTSRFLQELLLLSFNLPHGASGDLMDIDALTEGNEYYRTAIDKSFQLLDKMQQCSNEYDQLGRRKEARSIESSRLSYGCRILEDRSAAWAELKRKNEVVNKDKYDQGIAELVRLDQQTEQDHQGILRYRKSLELSQNPAQQKPKSFQDLDEDECEKLSGSEKDRCERFAEIRKRIGK